MKIREGFVSNSSSSSFIINLNNISKNQLQQIENHSKSKSYKTMYGKDKFQCWDILINKKQNTVRGSTSMDNFDMGEYLDTIGVRSDHIEWDN